MKRVVIILMLLTCFVQVYSADLFPFKEVNHKWNIAANGGYNHQGKVGFGCISATVRGFHITIGCAGSSHEHDVSVDKWNESASMVLQAGYQIPILKSLRIIPVVGMAGVGEVYTDGSDWSISNGQINNATTSELKYYFDYGAHIVFNHRKLIINLGATRYTLLGGIGLEF